MGEDVPGGLVGQLGADLKPVYTAPSAKAAEARFAEFAEPWRPTYPALVAMWERSWAEFIPFLDFPVEIRKLIYTTDESVKGSAVFAGIRLAA